MCTYVSLCVRRHIFEVTYVCARVHLHAISDIVSCTRSLFLGTLTALLARSVSFACDTNTVCACLSVVVCLCLSVCVRDCLSVCLSVRVYLCPCLCLSVCLCPCLFLFVCVSLSVSVSVSLSVCLSVSPSLPSPSYIYIYIYACMCTLQLQLHVCIYIQSLYFTGGRALLSWPNPGCICVKEPCPCGSFPPFRRPSRPFPWPFRRRYY